MPAPVSLCMIARDEESNLIDCVKPIAHLFHEMIVVDTGSTDRTPMLAGDLGCHVVHFPWGDDFAAARNQSLRHATGDWIFWMDADDRLDFLNVRRLEILFSQLGDGHAAYMMLCASLPKHALDPLLVLPHCRLFRRQKDIRWSRRVHEQIVPAIHAAGHQFIDTDIRIDHLGYKDPALARRKANRDLRLLRLEFAMNPSDPATLFNLGMAFQRTGEPQAALTHFLASLKNVTCCADWVRRLYAALGDTLTQLGRREEALALLVQGLGLFPGDAELVTRQARLLAQLDDLGTAERSLLRLLDRPRGDRFYAGQQAIQDRREARSLLGRIYIDQGRSREAVNVFQELLAEYPLEIAAWIGLGYAYLGQGRWADLDYVARQIEKCPGGGAHAYTFRALAHLLRGELDVARRWLDEAMAIGPNLPWARRVFAQWLQSSGASLSERIAVERDILRLSPDDMQARQFVEAFEHQQRCQVPISMSFTVQI